MSLWHCIYCSLVYYSGVGIDSSLPLYDNRQLTPEVTGFLTLNQLADFTFTEVEDLVSVLAPVLTPIYGAIGILRVPNETVASSLASETLSTSILTFRKNKKPHYYQQMVERDLFL